MVQAKTVLESVFRVAVAAADVPLRLGPDLLDSLVERQREQVAGIQVFVSSVKVSRIGLLLSFSFPSEMVVSNVLTVRIYVPFLCEPPELAVS